MFLEMEDVDIVVDDKHQIKVGEPGFPVAAAERGQRVRVSCDTTFESGIVILPE